MSISAVRVHPTVVASKLREGGNIVSEERNNILNSNLQSLYVAVPQTKRQWGLLWRYQGSQFLIKTV